jgi:RNA-binding protein
MEDDIADIRSLYEIYTYCRSQIAVINTFAILNITTRSLWCIMNILKGYQRKYLRGLAHGTKPSVLVGQKGITDKLLEEVNDELDRHELIKIKFIDVKERKEKQELSAFIEGKTSSHMVGMIGHTAIFYRQHDDPDKRKINVPQRP